MSTAPVIGGVKFGLLTTVRLSAQTVKGASWECRCECGRAATIRQDRLRSGKTRSCGCIQRRRVAELGRRTLYKHGHATARTGAYASWRAMRDRCLNPKRGVFAHYGGRGITICPEWQASFQSFLADMGPRPEGCTLDRIDVDGNYEPSNCRWATPKQQANNKRARARA